MVWSWPKLLLRAMSGFLTLQQWGTVTTKDNADVSSLGYCLSHVDV